MQVSELEVAAERAERRSDAVRRSAKADYDQRLEMELKEQQLRHERRVGELELEIKRLQTGPGAQAQEAFRKWVESRAAEGAGSVARAPTAPPPPAPEEPGVPPAGWVSRDHHMDAVSGEWVLDWCQAVVVVERWQGLPLCSGVTGALPSRFA